MTDKSVDAGLVSESAKATVDKLLAELQHNEAPLKQERNQFSGDRDMVQLE
jgi:hypothetical protein